MLNFKWKHTDSLYAFETLAQIQQQCMPSSKRDAKKMIQGGENEYSSWNKQFIFLGLSAQNNIFCAHTHTHSHTKSCELKKVIQDIKTNKTTKKSLINRIFFNELTSMYYIANNGKSQSPSNVRFDTDNQFPISNLLNRKSNHLYWLKQAIAALNSVKMLITFQALKVFWKTISRSNECKMLKLFMNWIRKKEKNRKKRKKLSSF